MNTKLQHSLFQLLSLIMAVCILTACNNEPQKARDGSTDTYSEGEINIAVDESLKPVFEELIDAFEGAYPKAKINAFYVAEKEASNLLLEGKVRVAALNRDYTDEEKATIDADKITPRSHRVATDGMAVITHPSNADSMLTVEQLSSILKGQTRTWAQLGGSKGLKDSIIIVFDKSGGGNVNYAVNRFDVGYDDLKSLVYAAGGNEAVIDYVSQNPAAIGFIGTNWITDKDTAYVNFRTEVQVALIADTVNPSPGDYYQPYLAFLALKKYPLARGIHLLLREPKQGLGHGFVNYVSHDKGQRVFQRAGLLPSNIPQRIVSINKKKGLE